MSSWTLPGESRAVDDSSLLVSPRTSGSLPSLALSAPSTIVGVMGSKSLTVIAVVQERNESFHRGQARPEAVSKPGCQEPALGCIPEML